MPQPRRRTALLALLCGFSAFFVGNLIFDPTLRAAFSPSFLSEWFRVGQVMRLAHSRYVDADKVTFEKLGRNAALGAVAGLDRYSEFLDKTAYAEQHRRSEQLFTGIGIIMQPIEGYIVVERVYAGGGAASAGLLPGDRIIAADGHDLRDAGLDDAGKYIRGVEGTSMKLSVLRLGVAEPLELTVERRTITIPTVSTYRILPDGKTAYIQLERFERRTPMEIAEAYEALRAQGADRLILDLRGNPGGVVDAAVETVGLFVPKNSPVTSLSGRSPDESESYRTPYDPKYPTTPLVVLVDAHSASASELTSGALQDHKRAVVVGTRTFGKGIVQSIYKLDDTTGLKITTAKYALPSGRTIHAVGVTPDVLVEEDADTLARRLVEEPLVKHTGGAARFTRRYGFAPDEDPVLRAAADLLAEKNHAARP